ncbi:MAG: AAA+ super family [Planctomycetota bacterium]|nr:MAG: AAA+ super family [Planctomycetota bacterium]
MFDSFRVSLLTGPRQCGKTTLVRQFATERKAAYVTLDEADALAQATQNPSAWLARQSRLLVIDEIQKAPALLQAIKIVVDNDQRPGQFLLTGSSNILLSARVSESLAGRMFVGSLAPFTQSEIDGTQPSFVDGLFSKEKPPEIPAPPDIDKLIQRILRGGYPEPALFVLEHGRRAWFESHLVTVLSRDVRDLADIDRPTALLHLLLALSARSLGPLNVLELASTCGLNQVTAKRYLGVLDALYLVRTLPAWTHSASKRLARRPKVLPADSAVHAHLAGVDANRLKSDRAALGPLLESFAINEILREAAWSSVSPRASHFRTQSGDEVDLVLEAPDGRVVGVDVRATSSPGIDDLRGLRALREAAGKHFHRGVMLCGIEQSRALDGSLVAMPISRLWK